jgi:hypothetical protein
VTLPSERLDIATELRSGRKKRNSGDKPNSEFRAPRACDLAAKAVGVTPKLVMLLALERLAAKKAAKP